MYLFSSTASELLWRFLSQTRARALAVLRVRARLGSGVCVPVRPGVPLRRPEPRGGAGQRMRRAERILQQNAGVRVGGQLYVI